MLWTLGIQSGFRNFLRHRFKRHLKSGAKAPAPTLRFDRALVKIDKMSANCETQPKTPKLTAHGSIRLFERPKKRRQPLWFNSNPVVRYLEVEAVMLIVKRVDRDLATLRREFDSIVEEVPK